MDEKRPLRVGHSTPDHCRVCKMERTHTIVAVDAARGGARVRCDTCGSLHEFRGPSPKGAVSPYSSVQEAGVSPLLEKGDSPLLGGIDVDTSDLDRVLRRIIREETGLTPVAPAEKWRGGELVLKPGREGLQPKTMPIDGFFAKVVSLRNRLRVLEQQVNAAAIPDDLKLKLQGYITGCYGSLTSFNVLFADDEDRFKGTGGAGE